MKEEKSRIQEIDIPPYEERRLKETIGCIQKLQRLKEEQKTCSALDFLYYQFKFISIKIWFIQVSILMLFGITATLGNTYTRSFDYGTLCSIFIPLLVISAIPEMCKNMYCRALEVESSTYFNIRKIFISKLLIVGMADLVMLTLILGMVAGTQNLPIQYLILYFLVPLNSTCCIYFSVLHWFKSAAANILGGGLCIVWSMMLFFLSKYQNIYKVIQLNVWGFLIVLSSIYIFYILMNLFKDKRGFEKYLVYESEWM